MPADFDFANLTNEQRRNVLRQVEMAKHAWLDTVFKELCERGTLPTDMYRNAHECSVQMARLPTDRRDWTVNEHITAANCEAEMARWKDYLEREGWEIVDDWTAAGLGAALKPRGKVISTFTVDVEQEATLPSHGNKPRTKPIIGPG